MVSINNEQKTEYDFYHVGGILTLTLTDVPANTTKIVVTFEGDTSDPDNLLGEVTGNFEVTDPGTKDAVVSLASGTGYSITFTDLMHCYEKNMTFNIPLPAQNYSRLQAVTVAASGGTNNCTVSKSVEGWGVLARAQGKKLTIDFNSITGGRGTFRGYRIHPGILKWDAALNGGAGGYALTDGADPLELLRYYKNDAALGVYYHQWVTLKNNLDGTTYSGAYGGDSDDIANCYIVENGIPWKIPGHSEWLAIFNNAESTVDASITLNNRNYSNNFLNYRNVLVDLSEATDVLGTDYSSLGLTTAGGDSGTNTGYSSGTLLFPDGAVISCPGLTSLTDNHQRVTVNVITYPVLRLLLDGGCAFIPTGGSNYNGESWSYGGLLGCYWSVIANNDGRRSWLRTNNTGSVAVGANYSWGTNLPRANTYMPVRVVSLAD